MADPRAQARKQLARILEQIGGTVASHAVQVRKKKLEKHRPILDHFKKSHGLGHGDANLLAHMVREHLAGGPTDPAELLEAQYAGKKSALRPIFDQLATIARSQGSDVEEVIQKTGVSFRRAKQFALVTAPSSKRVRLGLNLPDTPSDPRVKETKGMCRHGVDLTDLAEVDDAVADWIAQSYESAG